VVLDIVISSAGRTSLCSRSRCTDVRSERSRQRSF